MLMVGLKEFLFLFSCLFDHFYFQDQVDFISHGNATGLKIQVEAFAQPGKTGTTMLRMAKRMRFMMVLLYCKMV